jgi:hypothetical protein
MTITRSSSSTASERGADPATCETANRDSFIFGMFCTYVKRAGITGKRLWSASLHHATESGDLTYRRRTRAKPSAGDLPLLAG